jgi:hypothetical protein
VEAGALFVGGMIWIKPERSLFAYNEVQGPKTNMAAWWSHVAA